MKNVFLVALLIFIGSWQKINPKPFIALQITVLDDKGNFQEGAVVTLYETEEDYRLNKNAIKVPGKTNKRGRVMFKWDLKEISYYIRAEKGDMNNDGGGIKTEKLVKNRINKVNVIISGI